LHLDVVWLALYLIATSLFVPPLGHGLFVVIENYFSQLASRRTLCILLFFLSTIALRLFLFPVLAYPHAYAHDEFGYLLQADMFAHGHLAYPPHPMAPYLETFYVFFQPTYSTIYSPAQSAVLALGQLLGHPWIGVLLSTAAMVSVIYWMLLGWFSPSWAFLGAALVLVRMALFSYWMNSYWGGSVAAIGAALALGALPRLKHSQDRRDAWLLGLGVIILANSRPLEGLVFCVPLAAILIHWLYCLRAQKLPLPLRNVLPPVSVCLLSNLAFTLYYDWRLTGSPLTLPRALYYQRYYSVSMFIWGKIRPPLHYGNPQYEAFFNGYIRDLYSGTWASLKEIEILRCNEFWQFFLGGLLGVSFLSLPWLFRDRRIRPLLWFFLICVLGLIVSTWFEPHYAAPAFCVFWIVAIQAFRHFRRWEWRGRPMGVSCTRQIVALTLLMIPVCIHARLTDPYGTSCWNYVHPFPRDRVAAELSHMPGQHLVIVRYPPGHDYRDQWVYNAADIDRAKIVWAHEVPGQDIAPLLSYYSTRKVWLIEPDNLPPRLQPYGPDRISY
jgi:hypothetical protein